SGVIALTVSFGLGLSETIHFLNRMTRERKKSSARTPPAPSSGDCSRRAGAHSDDFCAGQRTRRACSLRPARASPVWLVERARHTRRARRLSQSTADRDHNGVRLNQRAIGGDAPNDQIAPRQIFAAYAARFSLGISAAHRRAVASD